MTKNGTGEGYAWVMMRVIDNSPDIDIGQRIRDSNSFFQIRTGSCSASPDTTWYRFGTLLYITGRYYQLHRLVNRLILSERFDGIDFIFFVDSTEDYSPACRNTWSLPECS